MESRFSNLVVNALFPRFCFGCNKEGLLWCTQCALSWWPVCVRAGCPFCGAGNSEHTCASCQKEVFLDGLTAFSSYANPVVRKAIAEWKYVGDTGVATVLQGWIARAEPMFAGQVGEGVFAPVPLHKRKRRARGFDQAGELADWFARSFNRPAYDLLSRLLATESQAGRDISHRRLGEFDNVFSVERSLDWIPERVILCDDVFTSGTTMDAAARALKDAGVKEVWGFVLAKGGK